MNMNNKREEFYYKKSYLKQRLQKDVIKDGIAYIPCKIDSIDDMISRFSIEECESLDGEFVDYLLNFVDCIPDQYPAVLEIHGPKFTEAQQERIKKLFEDEADYMLGKTEAENNHHKRVFWLMVLGTVASGVLLAAIKHFVDEIPLEFFYVIFWLFADSLVRYLFIEHFDYKGDKIRAGRIASMKIEFMEDQP